MATPHSPTTCDKIPLKQLTFVALEKLSGTCRRLKFLPWNIAFEQMQSKSKKKENLAWAGHGSKRSPSFLTSLARYGASISFPRRTSLPD